MTADVAREPEVATLLRQSTARVHLIDVASQGRIDIGHREVMADVDRVIADDESDWAAGRRIPVRRANDLEYLLALGAAAISRSVVVSVNTKYSEREADELIVRSGAVDGAPPFDDPSVVDPYVVFTTSGTTSRPKMVLHTQRSVARCAYAAAARFGYDSDSVVILALPLGGTFGLTSYLAAIAANATVVIVDRFDVDTVADAIVRFSVTAMNGTDDMFHRLLQHGADLSTIRLGGYAAFNGSLGDIVQRADAAGCTLCGLYGMSEVQALFSMRDPDASADVRQMPGGRLSDPSAEVRVVEPGTWQPSTPGAEGELQFRGPSLMAGYLREGGDRIDADLTATAIDGDGWFASGDAGSIDGKREFTFLARLGDTLRLGGFLVNPAEIEAVIMEADGVTGAQVVAVDRPSGTRPVAFVTGENRGEAADEAILDRCRQHLARFKVPIGIVHLDRFPVSESANGTKIRKTELRQIAAQRFGE